MIKPSSEFTGVVSEVRNNEHGSQSVSSSNIQAEYWSHLIHLLIS